MSQSPLSGLSDSERAQAFERFDLLRPFLEKGVPLARIEGLALKKLPLSAASIHRQVVTLADQLGESPPSYSTVYVVIRELNPGLVTLAHEGTKAYAYAFDLIHRHEATGTYVVFLDWRKLLASKRLCRLVPRNWRNLLIVNHLG